MADTISYKSDHFYMGKALLLAHKAMALDEVPVGAIVVNAQGIIIGRGYNQVERKHTQRAHAEMIALEQAARKQGNWRLQGCRLYVTLEPCKMCIAFIRLSRLDDVIYGASSPLFGYRLDNEESSWVYKNVMIKEGVREHESQELLKKFFKEKREKKGEYKEAGIGSD